MRPTALMPSRLGEPDFNPALDAFVLVLGADCEGPNRYRATQFPVLLDANGACRDEAECPECGSDPVVWDGMGEVVSGGEYRFRVYGLDGRRTYCRRCVSQRELDAVRDRAAAPQNTRNGGRR